MFLRGPWGPANLQKVGLWISKRSITTGVWATYKLLAKAKSGDNERWLRARVLKLLGRMARRLVAHGLACLTAEGTMDSVCMCLCITQRIAAKASEGYAGVKVLGGRFGTETVTRTCDRTC